MPKPKDPESYPKEYYALFDKVIEQGEHTVEGLTKAEASNLRFDLYAFRSALKLALPDIGHKYTRVSMYIKAMANAGPNPLETSPIWCLWFIDGNPQVQKIADSLGGIQAVADIELPVEPEAEPSKLKGVLNEFFQPDDE